MVLKTIKKAANAFFANATVNAHAVSGIAEAASQIGGVNGAGAINRSIEAQRRRMGGLWVGGSIVITADEITFRPNGINSEIHNEGEGLSYYSRLSEIGTVKRAGGFLTGIIDIESRDGPFRFRCFGADRVAAELWSRVPRIGADYR